MSLRLSDPLSPAAALDGRTGLISVIIPVWGEDEALAPLVAELRTYPEIREIIVSAARPQNGLAQRVTALGAAFVQNEEPNRGRQFNRGARAATADWVLFHHVDTELSRDHIAAIAVLDSEDVIGGAFYRKFDERHPWLRGLEGFERWHSRTFGTIYGDQSIFVRREHCLRMGGFAPIPLMEDVEFSMRLRRSGKIRLLDPPVRSCPRKQIEQGTWTVTLRNLLFLVLFRCGVPAQQLHSWYYSVDRQSKISSLSRWENANR